VADTANHTIRKVTSAEVVTTLAGLGGGPGSADGTGSAARFNQPSGVAVGGSGNIYVADTYNNTIRKLFAAALNARPVKPRTSTCTVRHHRSEPKALRGFSPRRATFLSPNSQAQSDNLT